MAAVESYEHRCHAGNKGDVWKHVILWEVLSDQLTRLPADGDRPFVYCETHTGHAYYPDRGVLDEYKGGFGQFRDQPEWLDMSAYFAAESSIEGYWGSSALVHRLLRERGVPYELHLWDTSRDVIDSLGAYFKNKPGSTVFTHLGDGYSGLLDGELTPHLVLVDPPTADWRPLKRVFDALSDPVVLAWYPLKSSSRRHEVSKGRQRNLSSTRAEVFQVMWAQPIGCSHQTVGCGVLVRGASEQCLRRLDGILRPVAMKLADGPVDSPYQRR
jgi:23S rRNA A2030 N6-methylase RlmJ